jgi:methylenetetrahydrofolate dehydrogenase (NADP+)/methenyltetrahydrofolate cyclohydrolase
MAKISELKKYPQVKILDGRKIAAALKKQLISKIKMLGGKPTLAIILVGQNPASVCYTEIKKKFAKDLGVNSFLFKYPASISQKILVKKISELNQDKKINGILVQLPLPQHLNVNKIIATVDPWKDVDGFGPKAKVTPGLNLSILKLIKAARQNLKNKKIVIIAKSETFSQSLAKILKKEKIKIKIIKPTSADLARQTKKADLLISAVGQPNFIKDSMVKRGAIIIDVGTTYKNGKIYGDVSNQAGKLASFITPIPGGVGPLTVAMLFVNLMKLTKLQNRSL